MMGRIGSGLFAVAACAAVLSMLPASPGSAAAKKHWFDLSWTGHREFTKLDKKYGGKNPNLKGCDGDNVSPALHWRDAPEKTKSYAIELFDLAGNAPIGFIHWVAYGIPASKTSLKEGEASKPSPDIKGGKSMVGSELYFGPCPPPGAKPHPFTFVLMATDLAPDALQPGLTRDELAAALKGHILDRTTLVLRFGN
jgi:Raf kinase inhibitor-like YbhB/YbcL family protein